MAAKVNIGKEITMKRIKLDKDDESNKPTEKNGTLTNTNRTATGFTNISNLINPRQAPATNNQTAAVESEYAFEFVITHLNADLTVEKEEIVRVRKSNEKRYTCKFCRRTSKDHTELMAHVKVHYKQNSDGSTMFCCLDCETRPLFNLPMKLIQHYHQSHKEINRELQQQKCVQCHVEYPDLPTLTKHMQTKGAAIFRCTICSDKFITHCYLNQHMEKVHNLLCDLCDTRFSGSAKLYDHRKKSHSIFDCLICQANGKRIAFSNGDEYNGHMKSHEPDKVEMTACRYCTACFMNKERAGVHERKHTPEEKIAARTCGYCKLVFADKSKKAKHIWVTHKKGTPQQ